MTANQFYMECILRGISPQDALECKEVAIALRKKDDNAVAATLDKNLLGKEKTK